MAYYGSDLIILQPTCLIQPFGCPYLARGTMKNRRMEGYQLFTTVSVSHVPFGNINPQPWYGIYEWEIAECNCSQCKSETLNV